MAISLSDLLSVIARGATRAQWEVKQEESLQFQRLFKADADGNLEPNAFMLKLVEHEALVPWINLMHQDQFSIKKLKLAFKTAVNITTVDSDNDAEDKVMIDCSLKQGLLKKGTEMTIEMDLESNEPTEGVEQIRDHFANELSNMLKGINNNE